MEQMSLFLTVSVFKRMSVFSDFNLENKRHSVTTKYKLGEKSRSSIH